MVGGSVIVAGKTNQLFDLWPRGLRQAARRGGVLAVSLLLLGGVVAQTTHARRLPPSVPQREAAPDLSLRQDEKEVRTLDSSSPPIERELAGNETHTYQISLTSGQFLRVSVDQRGIDLAVTLFAPDGQMMTEVDSPNGTQGLEPISLGAEVSGLYRLVVRPLDKGVPAGRYEVKIEELRSATPQDGDRIAAEKAYGEAVRLRKQGTVESRQRAVEKHREAFQLWRAAGERRREAGALFSLCVAYSRLEEYQKGLDCHQQALLLWRALGDRRSEANTLNRIGRYHEILSDKQSALEYFNQALVLYRVVGDRRGEARTLNNLGAAINLLDEKQKAIDYLNQSLLINQELGDRRGEAETLHNIGDIYKVLSEYQQALRYYNQALAFWRDVSNPSGEAYALNYVGEMYQELGEHQQALDTYNQSLALWRRAGDRRGEAYTLHNLGQNYGSLGDYRQAVEYFNRAVLLHREAGNRQGEAYTLHYAGEAYISLGEWRQALDVYTNALRLRRSVGERRGEGYDLHNIGTIYRALGDKPRALDYFAQSLSIRRALRDQSGEAATLYEIALTERDAGDLAAAQSHIEAALAITESVRTKIAAQELRTSYRATVQNYYEFYTELLMRLHRAQPAAGHAAAALQSSERARARSLIETLSEARADIRQGVDPVLLQRERSLQQQLNATAERQTRLLGGRHTTEQAAAVKKDIDALTAAYQQVQSQIRQRSPRYAALTQPRPLTVRELQTEVLDADTVLLEYALGDERSYVWVVTPTSLHSYELPKRAEIEDAVRRVYQLLSDGQPWRESEQTTTRYGAAAGRLSRMLLAPVAAHLTAKRL
ncbi:MAG: tetratricopeptide repeat protein, partial [Acidobacteriota bacterium]|nr:tetratricopeptide repeat protein [Acidobacteriota bacterium]